MLEPQQGATYDQQLAIAQTSERLGFGGFFRSDHFVAGGSGSGLPGPTDAWATLAAIARETERIRLGTMVTCSTFRFPGLLAITAGQVDVMSGGRVELGLGAGWNQREHEAYGVPFPAIGERFERLEEQLRIVTGLWATPEGQTWSFEGRHYNLTDSPALPKPVQSPHPPIIIGGWGHRCTPRLAASYANEFNVPFHGLAAGTEQIGRVRKACERIGRDPSSMVYSAAQGICAGVDEAEVHRRAAAIGRTPDKVGLAGTPEQLVDKVGEWAEGGVSRLYLQILDLDDLEHLELLATEVLPQV